MRRAAVAGVLIARAAAAAPDAAIEVDRDDEPPGRPELGFDAGAPIGDYAFALRTAVLDQPIVLHGGGVSTAPVDHRETLSLGGAYTLGNRLVLDLMLPLAHQVGDRLTGVPALGDNAALAHFVAGDLRIAARLRVGHGVFLRGELTAPTGDAQNFAGAGGWTYGLHLIGRLELASGVVVAGTAGVRLASGDAVVLADRAVGDEVEAAVGVVVPLPPLRPLWCGRDQVLVDAEVDAAIGDSFDNIAGPSPVEARIGLVSRPRAWLQVGARLGVGLDDEIGAPRLRAMLEVSWHAGKIAAPPEASPARVPDDDEDVVSAR
jgi:hypothetical protein